MKNGFELVFVCGAGSIYYNANGTSIYKYVVPGVGSYMTYAEAAASFG